jgi:hypothetical protein
VAQAFYPELGDGQPVWFSLGFGQIKTQIKTTQTEVAAEKVLKFSPQGLEPAIFSGSRC